MTDEKENGAYDLEQFDGDYAEAEPDLGGETVDLPDGKYQMIVEKADLQVSTKGNQMLVWRMRVLGPRYAGAKHWHRNMIVTRENIKWLKKDLVLAGLELTKLSDLPNRLHELVEVVVEVQLKTKGDVQNSYVNKRIRTPGAAQGSSGQAAPNDDFPF